MHGWPEARQSPGPLGWRNPLACWGGIQIQKAISVTTTFQGTPCILNGIFKWYLGVLKSFWLKSDVIGWTLCRRRVWRTPGLVGSLYPTTKAIKVLPQLLEGNLAIAFWNPIIENFGHKNPVVAMGVTQSWLLLTAMTGVPHAPAEGQSLYIPTATFLWLNILWQDSLRFRIAGFHSNSCVVWLVGWLVVVIVTCKQTYYFISKYYVASAPL